MNTNRLAGEKSPYLLQHAHNPVDWYPWGEEAFAQARTENRPIFLSIGYSTCHWCHVMERESFENEEIASLLNRYFVPVKVDREERPDVDRIYMLFVQATTGGGGWPMSVWLTPELKPFFGGTYFPPDNRYGRPGFKAVLEYLANAWMTRQREIEESGSGMLEQLRAHAEGEGRRSVVNEDTLAAAYNHFRRSYDARLGGFGAAPKFPRPSVHNLLLRYWRRTGNEEARDMVLHTLREMAKGGMNDQLGGGFHRYSVDAQWFVPHFEKMLYDQAQLAASYLEAYQITGEEFYSGIARDIFEYVLRDMTDAEGGFYSAEDADSVIDPAEPGRKGEGAFYVWTLNEIREVLGEAAAGEFAAAYGVEEGGNVREDPHGEFAGKNILYNARPGGEQWKARLLQARSQRVRPHLDDKILASWNGLMISSFAKGAQVLGEPRYLEAARRAADFVKRRLWNPAERLLRRRYRNGEASVAGFLDDYAQLAQALLDLYEAGFRPGDLHLAVTLAETMRERFEDPKGGGYFSTEAGATDLLLRMKEDYDGAEPSGNSVAAQVLMRLAAITGREDFRQAFEATLEAFSSRAASMGMAMPQMLAVWELRLANCRQVILAGEKDSPGMREMLACRNRRFTPGEILLLADAEGRQALGKWQPSVLDMIPLDGKATAYVCENFTCRLPVTSVEELDKLLQ